MIENAISKISVLRGDNYPNHKAIRIEDRIVSINQPHIRPIVRGKAGSSVEFGAKISASCVDGYVFLDRLSWDNFNESPDFIPTCW